MAVPAMRASRASRTLVHLVLISAVLVASPCAAQRIAATDEHPLHGRSFATSDAEPFRADPLSRSGPEGAPRVPPSGMLAAPDGAAATDWARRIDDAWGPSRFTPQQLIAVFDQFWGVMDRNYACFQGLEADWTALRTAAHAKIQAGVSRGRFAGILNHAALALRESHTVAEDVVVNFTELEPGVPLFVVGGWGDNRHFQAGLTPLPDSSLLVYKAATSHPLGLAPGDIVLGYGGVPWKRLYRELLEAEMPLTGWWWGSSGSSWTHSMLMSAGLNWHLFDTIDVVKHATGDTVHLALSPLRVGSASGLDCTEQLPIPGVPMPDFLVSGDPVSWGIVSGTQIGYVYVRAWIGTAGTQFRAAVQTLLTDYQTTGLIFDFRTNYGGNMFQAYPALEQLFGGDVSTIGFARRCSPGDHLAMCPSPNGPPSAYVIHGAAAGYDRPIAVLVGPGAVSAGDQIAHLFQFHPRARFFGKSTSTAFNVPTPLFMLSGGWSYRFAIADAYRVTAPLDHLTHDELVVDHPVWLEPDDVARGVDTVAETAIRWIVNVAPVCGAARATIADPGSPDHGLVPVAIDGVSDPNGDPVRIVATTVTQDEPVNGTGDGDTCPDATIVDGVARVRRERAGTGDGRVYEVSFTASDDLGAECQGTVQVCLPHDRGQHRSTCLDDAERHDALACADPTTVRHGRGTATLRALPGAPAGPGGVALHYALPRDGWVDLGVYDVAGRRLLTLLQERQTAGEHRLDWSHDGLRPGVYFTLLKLDQETIARTTLVAK